MKIAALLHDLGGTLHHERADALASACTVVSIDSRAMQPGGLFFACKGATASSKHGDDYVDDAIKNGASCIVGERVVQEVVPTLVVDDARLAVAIAAENFFGAPSKKLAITGITGTNGKTTTTWLLAQLWNQCGKQGALLGTLGYGQPGKRLTKTGFTTPEAERLSAILADVFDWGCMDVAMEVSSHALLTRRAAGIHFSSVAFTNLSPEHLDLHGDMESYFRAKAALFDGRCTGPTILPARDDEWSARLLAAVPGAITYGIGAGVVRADGVALRSDGMTFVLSYRGQKQSVSLPLVGEFNVENVLLAAAVVLAGGSDFAAVASGIGKLSAPPGRMEIIPRPGGSAVVDFAHTPDALAQALRTLRATTPGRIVVVFGCGGDRDQQKRPRMAEVAESAADAVVVTNDNPRSESPAAIAEQICRGFTWPRADFLRAKHYCVLLDRKRAIEEALAFAGADDVVLIAGKGHESTQTIGDEVLPFDDRDIARRAP